MEQLIPSIAITFYRKATLLKRGSSDRASSEKKPRSRNLASSVVVHLSDHNPVMVAQVDYRIRAEQSINGKETTEYIHKVSMI